MTPPKTNLPKSADSLAIGALIFAGICLLAAYATTSKIHTEISALGTTSPILMLVYVAVVAATATLFWPAIKSFLLARKAAASRSASDAVETRIQTAAAKDQASLTFGWGVFALLVFAFFAYIFMNNSAVGKTFFYLPLVLEKWMLIASKFVSVNIFVFLVAEVLVLVLGLVIALARIMPGAAGKPIRFLATVYCDVFRGIPAIVTLYLVGFGIPTSGIPEFVIPWVYGLFADTSAMTVQQLRDISRVPPVWWCILALTLTYSAYVAEVYRAGIESIHWSQVSAARSLGLSYLQTMRFVVVPQAVRRVIAPLLNDFIGLQKDTALVQILGVVDAFNASRGVAANAFNLSPVTVVAILFVLITIPQARLVDHLMEKDAARMRAGGA
jgi:polar amino acid transport system permease protein